MNSRNIITNGYLTTPLKGEFKPIEVQDSILQTISNWVDEHIKEDGDWQFLENAIKGERLGVLECFDKARQ